LFLDISIGNDESDKIMLYEGDNIWKAASLFCEKHNLDEDTCFSLIEVIET
jgi:hypothetical protein